ncbi:MAG TPA: hypothetical protein VHT25_07170 [Solirubrobacteraceae bacterium]|jgi:hypothetical protein|nr:hypothetical protein [Solirubrobacteraceae bacterium]
MLSLNDALLGETISQLRGCGRRRNECVVYWTGALAEQGVVDAALHPSHSAGPDFYEVTQRWLHETSLALARGKRTIRAQVHTHSGRAFHSRSDDSFPIVAQPGFLSLVLPHHAVRDDLAGAYLAQLGADGRWRDIPIEQGLVIG